MSLLQKSIELATKAHTGQFRKYEINGSRMPYIVHPMEVMKLCWRLGFGDEITLCCAILHDTYEDNQDTPEILNQIKMLGVQEIVNVVFDLTLLKDEKKEVYMSRFSFSSINPRSLVVKACDRICNVEDFKIQDPKYTKKYLEKAKPIRDGLVKNCDRIEKMYGQKAMQNLWNRWDSL